MNKTTTNDTIIDLHEVRRAIEALIVPEQVVEIRALQAITREYSKPHTVSGYFNNVNALVSSLKAITTAKGIYFTINPCHPDLIARANNRLRQDRDIATTTDANITARRWLVVDCDPKRAGNISDISASADEHEAALKRVHEIQDVLQIEGWPDPVEVDTGNGAYLLYPIDLPSQDDGLVKRVLQGLAKRFDDESVCIDQTVFNAARIIRLCGTWNCKGDSIEERPHRIARLLKVPTNRQVVSRELLESIAMPAQEPKRPSTPKQTSDGANRAWALKALQDESYNVTSAPVGTRNEQLFKSAATLGEIVGGGSLSRSEVEQELEHAATNAGLSEGEIEKTIKRGIEKGMKTPRKPLAKEFPEYHPGSNGNGNSHSNGHYQPHIPKTETDFILQCLGEDEAGDAALFAHLFRGKVIHDTTGSEWYKFGKHRWEVDTCGTVKLYISGKLASTYLETAAAITLKAKAVADDDGDEATKLKTTIKALTGRALALRKAARINNVLSLVIPQEGMHITSDKWDSDPWLLPVQNGVVDLHTGQLRDGKPEDYVKTASPTKWAGLNTQAERWDKALTETFEDRDPDERKELIGYLRRSLGYGITGLTVEEIFLVLFGEDGRNGKDTIIGGVRNALGPLAGVVSNDVFLSTGRFHAAGSATPHLVELQGKRIVWANEPESGARFNAAQVKDLTGGSPISARQLHGRQYSFEPTHLMLLLTNHKPHADATDNAFWARLRLITFNMRFVDNPDPEKPNERKPDKTLKRSLEAEAAGILAWLVRGCLEWQTVGLNAPASVLAAGKQYQKEEDNIARFLDECCLIKPELEVRANQLYKRYDEWCKEGNMHALNSTNFGQRIAKSFQKKRGAKGHYYQGLCILDDGQDGPEGSVYTQSGNVPPDEGIHTTTDEPVEPVYDSSSVGSVCKNQVFTLHGEQNSKNQKNLSFDYTPYTNGGTESGLDEPVEQSEGVVYTPKQVYTDPTHIFTPESASNYPYDVIAMLTAQHKVAPFRACLACERRNWLPWYNGQEWSYQCGNCNPGLYSSHGRNKYLSA